MQKTVFFGFQFYLFLIVIASLLPAQNLLLNEIMSSNSTTISDEDGDYEDWIEVFYSGDEPLNLEGLGISDDYDQPFRWVFPDTTIYPGEYMLLWASNKDRAVPGSELHTNFAISASGEEVILTHPDGTRIDELPPTEIATDISIGRQPDGTGNWYYFTEPTPGRTNDTEGFAGQLEPPIFSHKSGFYRESFELNLEHSDSDVTFYYTLDGSEPTKESGIFDGPVLITGRTSEPNNYASIPTNFISSGTRVWLEPKENLNKATIIRVKAVKPGRLSAVASKTFFVFPEGEQFYSLPVVSIVTDSLNLFGHDNGIYVPGVNHEDGDHGTGNYYQRGIEWERPAFIQFFEENGELGFQQNMGIRIHGGWTRRLPQKSLRLYARNIHSESRFNYPIFTDQEYDNYNRLILRNSGQDFSYTMFMDAAAQSLIRHFNVDTQAYRPVIVFLNGEYWGIQNFRERYDRHYLERVYGVDPDNIDLLTHWNTVVEGSNARYNAMYNFIRDNDLSIRENFNYVNTLMDIDNFLDYYSAQIYYGNFDWPQNNIDFWRLDVPYDYEAPAGHDGRWRWLLYDVDYSLGHSTHDGTDADLDLIARLKRDHWSTLIFRNLLENDQFRTDFINRISDHLNTAFTTERVSSVIDSLRQPLEPEIDEHIARWRNHGSRENWENRVNRMYDYAADRPGYLRQHMHDHFELGDDITLTVDVSSGSGGYVQVNSIDIHSSTPGINNSTYPWSGEYFSQIPVTLNPHSKPGYHFSHWEIDGEDPVYEQEYTRTFEQSTTVKAFFTSQFADAPRHNLSDGYYLFTEWYNEKPEGSYPEAMLFVYMAETEPGLDAIVAGITSGRYDLDSRTRINGLGEEGFAFINTSNLEGNPGYPGLRLGGALLTLDTQDEENIQVSWQGGTVLPNSRIYNLRLQYRIGNDGPFQDVLDEDGNPVVYQRHEEAGHSEFIGPVNLPEVAEDEPEVQLLWRYYYTGEREDEESGQRSKMNISEIHVTSMPPGNFPAPHILSDDPYRFEFWPADTTAGVAPAHMAFVYMDEHDPSEDAEIFGFTSGAYNLESRTRITGLNDNGFAFFNTGNQQGNPGYPGTRLGGALLGLSTQDRADIEINFTAGTVLPNSRVYHLRLQYRVGNEGPFLDVNDGNGNPVEYHRNELAGHSQEFGPILLPAEVNDQEYVQLLWRYYHTGDRLDEGGGQRSKLHVSDIKVTGRQELFGGLPIPDEFSLHPNYPNPFNPGTTIKFDLPEQEHVRVEIFNSVGQRVHILLNENIPAGTHRIPFDASSLASGVYIYRIVAGSFVKSRGMTFIK